MKIALRILLAVAAIAGIVFGIIMISEGENLSLPEKYVYVSSSSAAYNYSWGMNTGAEYLGGDAYNYIVEASLKAGYYNAVSNRKVILRVGGCLLLFGSLFTLIASMCSLQKSLTADTQVKLLQTIADNTGRAPDSPLRPREAVPEPAPEQNPEEPKPPVRYFADNYSVSE